MTSPARPLVECRVSGGEKLPADSGGSDVFCAAIVRAAAEQAPERRFKVDAQVTGASMITAVVTTADGKTLPKQEFSISDRGLNRSSLELFASNLVGMVARDASR